MLKIIPIGDLTSVNLTRSMKMLELVRVEVPDLQDRNPQNESCQNKKQNYHTIWAKLFYNHRLIPEFRGCVTIMLSENG